MTLLIFVFSCFISSTFGQSTCGVPSPGFFDPSSRIIGGTVTTPNVWPWQLAIETDDGSQFNLHCGGVIIGANWALTAAHCVTPRPGGEQLLLIAGMYNRTEWFVGTQIRTFTQDHIIYHPEYDADTLMNDIAIIHIMQPLDLSGTRVRAICLPPSSSTSYVENPNCYITGWGLTSPGGQQSDSLKRIGTDVIDPLHCELRMNRTSLPTETCCFDEVKRAETPCQGDLGGPVACAVNAQFYVAGIGSKLSPNCDPRIPQIYTNVPVCVDWIREVTGITE